MRIGRTYFGVCVGLFLAAFAYVGQAAEAVYTVKCRYYYQDAAILINPSVEFVVPIGYLGKYLPGETVIFGCSPTKLPGLECARGYYVSGWDLDRDWGDNMPGIGGFTPVHRRQYGAGSLLSITFSSSEIGTPAPSTFELIPHIAMMHYTLAYDANGGAFDGAAPARFEYYYSTDVTAEGAVCSREGHTFTGWNTRANGTGVAVAFNQKVNGDTFSISSHLEAITLYAQWKTNDYQLRLRPGVGIEKIYYRARSSGEATSSSLEWKETTTSLDVPVAYATDWSAYATAKRGYTYEGTSARNPETGEMGLDGAFFEPKAQANKIRVVYDGNGKTSGSMSPTEFTYDKEGSLADLDYVRTYTVTFDRNFAGGGTAAAVSTYGFIGWNDRPDGTGSYSYPDHARVTNPCGVASEDAMLYAQWEPKSITLVNPARTGYAFGGWFVEPECQTKVGEAGELFVPAKSVTLYAKWTQDRFTVRFCDGHRDAGNALVRMASVGFGGKAEPPSPPVHEGWRFTGWDSDAYLNVTQDLTIRALYESGDYHVTYNSNYRDGQEERAVESAGCGPEAASDTIEILSADSLDIPFRKTGYEFLGWAWNPQATGPDWLAGSKMAYSVISDYRGADGLANLYAVWQPITYRVHFAPNGATGTMTDQTLAYDRPALLAKNAFKQDGKAFRNWKDAKGNLYADKAEVTNLTTTADATITLTAQWDETGSSRFVRFDPNGATNGTMAVQRFKGTEPQHLSANEFSKTGYTFAGWATAPSAPTIAYADRAYYHFEESAPRVLTNTLYAVWEPIRYTILFNTGTNDVLGTIQPLTNCAYDAQVTLPGVGSGYTNFVSEGLSGWAWRRGEMAAFKIGAVVSNLTAVADDCVTLYAQWNGIGELSEAVGLTNAVLQGANSWCRSEQTVPAQPGDTGHPVRIARINKGSSPWDLEMVVRGGGRLRFGWYYKHQSRIYQYFVKDNGTILTNLASSGHSYQKYNWDSPVELPIVGSGRHSILWSVFDGNPPNVNDLIALDDIEWIPDPSMPEYETYTLKYAETKDAPQTASLPSVYTVTNETFAFAPLANVEGWAFDGWSPSNVVKGTTGDITVKAKWKRVAEMHEVVFDLAGGAWVGGGALTQLVEHTFAAVAPEVTPPPGRTFAGWDQAFTNVTADLKVAALYGVARYRIDYANTLGLANPNPLGYTADESFDFKPLDDTAAECFAGWSPAGITNGMTGPVTVTASWNTQMLWTVSFKTDEHVGRTGGGALVQTVRDGASAVAPELATDEGFEFAGWDGDFSTVHSNLTLHSQVRASECFLSIDGEATPCRYGDVIERTTSAERTMGLTNLVCVGWTGAGCVPGSGTDNEVSFTATGDGSLHWNHTTNYWVSVTASVGGSVAIVDARGQACATNEFWAADAARFLLEAVPDEGCHFVGWVEADEDEPFGESVEELRVTAPVSLRAKFEGVPCDVSFVLGDHLTRTGGGALQQTVAFGAAAEAPEVKAARGYVFVKWDADFSCVVSNTTVCSVVEKARNHTVTFVLGDHLTRTGGGALVQTVLAGEAAVEPTVKAAKGYSFAGWDTTNFLAVVSNMTVNARVDSSLVHVSVEVEGNGTVRGGNVDAEKGSKLTLTATAKSGSVFSGWWLADEETCLSQATKYVLTVSATNNDLVARFILKTEDWARVSCGEVADEYERGVAIEPVAVTGEGGSLPTVKVTGLPTGLKFANGAISGKPTKSGVTTATVTVTTAGKAKASAALVFVVRAANERIVRLDVPTVEGQTPGKATGAGIYAAGKKVTVKATASKGYVFNGWYDEAETCVSQAASHSFTMPDEDVALTARFITTVQDAASVRASINGVALFEEVGGVLVPLSPATNVCVGVYLEWPLVATADSAVTVAVSGLPSGLKFTAKDIVDSKTKEVTVPAMTIYGTPTAASKVDRSGKVTPSQVKVTVTTAGKTKVASTLALTVDALPAALVGTYAGGSTNDPTGSASVTFAKTGKVSGKWVSEGKTWTLTAANLDAVVDGGQGLTALPAGDRVFLATATFKCGKDTETHPLVFAVNDFGYGKVVAFAGTASTLGTALTQDIATTQNFMYDVYAAFSQNAAEAHSASTLGTASTLFSATCVPWKTDAELKDLAKELKGERFTVASDDGVTLTGTVGGNGTVTVAGSFDLGAARPYAATVSSTLVPVDEDLTRFELFVYYAPNVSKKFDGYAKNLLLRWDGSELVVVE